MRIGILTGGGDCPGLNAVIRAVVRSAQHDGDEVIGFRDGWSGVLTGDHVDLTPELASGILHLGGTILGTSRQSALEDRNIIAQRFDELRRDALITMVALQQDEMTLVPLAEAAVLRTVPVDKLDLTETFLG